MSTNPILLLALCTCTGDACVPMQNGTQGLIFCLLRTRTCMLTRCRRRDQRQVCGGPQEQGRAGLEGPGLLCQAEDGQVQQPHQQCLCACRALQALPKQRPAANGAGWSQRIHCESLLWFVCSNIIWGGEGGGGDE